MGTKTAIECLELQITELEMLTSMYPKKDELTVSDPDVVADINNYISGKSKILPKQLAYSLQLEIPDVQDRLELNVSLPCDYPEVEPIVYVRSTALNRCEQNKLNTAMPNFITSTQCKGELRIGFLIDWIMEHALEYCTPETKEPTSLSSNYNDENSSANRTFSRLWIYSHHIYNKNKRKDILALGKELNLSGFSLPGKPGIICVEGYAEDCDSFFQSVRQMSWKKLSLNHKETFELDGKFVTEMRKFDPFQELSFQVRKGPAREYHMDMGEFYKFLELHSCGFAFEHIFGFEGHVSGQI